MRQEAGIMLIAAAVALAGCLGGSTGDPEATPDDVDAAGHDAPTTNDTTTENATVPDETTESDDNTTVEPPEEDEAPPNGTDGADGADGMPGGAVFCDPDGAMDVDAGITGAASASTDKLFHLMTPCDLTAVLDLSLTVGDVEVRLVGPGDHLLLHERWVSAAGGAVQVGGTGPDEGPAPAGPYTMEWAMSGSGGFTVTVEGAAPAATT